MTPARCQATVKLEAGRHAIAAKDSVSPEPVEGRLSTCETGFDKLSPDGQERRRYCEEPKATAIQSRTRSWRKSPSFEEEGERSPRTRQAAAH